MRNEFVVLEDDESDETDEDPDEDSGKDVSCVTQKATDTVNSEWWGYLVMGMIILNTLVMALQAQFPEMQFANNPKLWAFFELSFLAFFTVEIVLRLCVQGCSDFFCAKDWEERRWNWFDFTVVTGGVVSLAIRPGKRLQTLEMRIDANANDWSNCLLLLRSFRILRAIRIFKRLRKLHLLIRGMVKSFEAVFWILVLGFLIILIFAITATTVIGNHSKLWQCAGNCTKEEREAPDKIEELFGDLGRSMWTMFQFVTLDSWASIIRLVSERIWIMKFFFLFYTLIASFALISLLTGVMAEHIMSESQKSQVDDEQEDIQTYTDTLKRHFQEQQGATPGVGLSFNDLSQMLSKPEVNDSLKRLGVSESFTSEDLNDVFTAMDLDGDGVLTWDEFQRGLRNIHGAASGRELSLVRADVQRVLRLAKPIHTLQAQALKQDAACTQRLGAVEERLERLEAAIMELVQVSRHRQARAQQ